MKNYLVGLIALVIIASGIYLLVKDESVSIPPTTSQLGGTTTEVLPPGTESRNKTETIIGTSAQNRDIIAYHFGTGEKEILLIGGIHGGYEWNTVLLAYEIMDHLRSNPGLIPESYRVTVVPVLNPDGLYKVVATTTRFSANSVPVIGQTIAGRFNGNNVDLNRNFDCNWKSTGVWQNRSVSGGTRAFSEPEAVAVKNYIESTRPEAVVIWFSAAGGIYASSCGGDISAQTKTLTDTYASASGYPAHDNFDFYETSGDMANWLAKVNIPAISVLLTNHQDTERSKNVAGVNAVLELFSE